MAKMSKLKKEAKQAMPNFDLLDLMIDESPADEAVVGILGNLVEVYCHQQQTAIELTKLVIENSAVETVSEEEIFSTFKRASKVVGEISPIKELWEKINDQ